MAPLVTISDIDELSTRPGRRFIEVTQLVKDWNRDPSRRSLMVLEPPTSGSRAHRTAMAAITRCLCMRDRVALPTWVHDYGPLAEPVSLSGESLDGPMGDFIRAYTPTLASSLGVYFDRALLDSR